MKQAKDTDFTVSVEGVGDFRYARRTLGDNLKIRSEFLRLLDGMAPDADQELSLFSNVFATHRVLCVSAPGGWEDLASLGEGQDGGNIMKVLALWDKIGEAEYSFRQGPNSKSKEAGA